MLGTNALGHPVLNRNLVDKLRVERVTVVQLEPLKFFVECARVLEVQPIAQIRAELRAQRRLVADKRQTRYAVHDCREDFLRMAQRLSAELSQLPQLSERQAHACPFQQ